MRAISIAALATLAVGALAQNLYSNQSSDVNVPQLEAVTTTRSGVAAAPGARWSEVQANGAGVQPESNTAGGFSVHNNGTTNFRLADDFSVTGPGWNVTGFKFYAYQTGSAPGASPILGGNLNIWSGRPEDDGTVLVGTGSFSSVTNTIAWAGGGSGLVHRIFNTDSPAPGTAPDTTRIIREVEFSYSGVLGPGTYWVDVQLLSASGTSLFAPSTTHLNSRGVAGAKRPTVHWNLG